LRPRRLVFGEDAELYDRVRPSYPRELVDELVSLAGGVGRALDAACGTGKATVPLAQRGFAGVGVEADAEMARVAARNLTGYPGWRVDVADFEGWQPHPGDGLFDLITVAQAWHWIDHERGARQAERLLRSGGWLAIFGHEPEFEETPLRHVIDAIFEELDPAPSARSLEPPERLPPGSSFGEPIEREYRGFRDYSASEWIALQATQSSTMILPAATRDELLRRLADAIDAHGGFYRHRYVCRMWAAARR